jgi:hypothetical protein
MVTGIGIITNFYVAIMPPLAPPADAPRRWTAS